MNEEILKKINFDDTIYRTMNNIIEAFVTFYEESNRDKIIEKFNNMMMIGYCKPEDFSMQIETTEILKLRKLMDEFIQEINIKNIDKDKLKEIFLDEISELDCISSLEAYIDYKNGNRDRLNDTIVFLNKIYEDINEDNIDMLIENGFFMELDDVIPLHNKNINIFKEFILSTEEYKLYLKKCKELREKLSKKYLKRFLLELKKILSNEDYLKVEEEYNLIVKSYSDLDIECNEIYLNKELLPSLFEYFSKESKEILNNESDYRKEDIQNQQILFFKK